MLSIVACCHGVKICVHICLSGLLITTKWCCDQDVKFVPGADFTKERAISAVRCEKEGMLLQPLLWRYVECAIHHERDVREE